MKRIPVVSISPNGERTHYSSMKEAAEAIHVNLSQIFKAINLGYTCHGLVLEKEEADG